MVTTVGDNKHRPMVDMNVTPLIDVLLVLIITFMVVTNLTPKGLDALAPQPSPTRGPNDAIVVAVDAGGNVKVNSMAVEMNALGTQLDAIFKARNNRIIFVTADSSLPFGTVAKVIDVARGANIDKIGLMTQRGMGQ